MGCTYLFKNEAILGRVSPMVVVVVEGSVM